MSQHQPILAADLGFDGSYLEPDSLVMSYGRRLGYDWRMDTIGCTSKTPYLGMVIGPATGHTASATDNLAKRGR